MNLKNYIPSIESGSSLASRLGVSSVLVSQWRSGVKQVAADRCPEIEKATNGAVRCEDLRPDIDWAYLRGTDKAA